MDSIPDSKLSRQETQNKNSETQKLNCHCLQMPKLKKKNLKNFIKLVTEMCPLFPNTKPVSPI